MPLNRKNRVTVKKNKMFKSKTGRLNGWLVAEDYCLNSVIVDKQVVEIKNNTGDGCTCRKCGNYNEYAEPNQDDGSFICFSCKV